MPGLARDTALLGKLDVAGVIVLALIDHVQSRAASFGTGEPVPGIDIDGHGCDDGFRAG